jgi:1-aminocyclopropane-1-carboxylate deaminase/D-cysteine desulfhydrase-like pyridoxal-dependent ACC family enzyme
MTIYQADIFGGEAVKVEPNRSGNMLREFIVPPFSVLDTSQAYWLERKRAWLSLGIQSELGRGLNLSIDDDHLKEKKGFTRAAPPADVKPLMFDKTQAGLNKLMGNGKGFETGTSVFDPVLCELMYRWFCPPKSVILDPFAGGSVRGIVAAKLGHLYKGVDLSARQIEVNNAQATEIVPENRPLWFWGDSAEIKQMEKVAGLYDFVFSCPPYFDLEVYGSEAGELSAMAWPEFCAAYKGIVKDCIFMLRNNRFACFVVGEVRDKQGYYRNLIGLTIKAFEQAGAHYYNEAILVTSIGTLPLRAKKYMNSNRKLGKRHQNALVFVKGDPKLAAAACGPINADNSVWSGTAIPEAAHAQETPDIAGQSATGAVIAARPTAQAPEPAGIIETALELAPVDLTPVERRGDYWFKRDDLYSVAGVNGGKARTILKLTKGAVGLVTAGSRTSTQVSIVAHIAAHLGIPSEGHTPKGRLPVLLQHASSLGMNIIQHSSGYNTVISKRAKDSAAEKGWTLIPFGMEHEVAVQQTAAQTANIPAGMRLVVPVGSGMSLAGILQGLQEQIRAGDIKVLGVVVGAKPDKRLDKFAPADWRELVTLETSILKYSASPQVTEIEGLQLDSIYEAKCISFLKPGDCLWVIGIKPDVNVAPQAQQTGFIEKPVTWKFSAKWLNKQVDCTLEGISRCGGVCCIKKATWPASSNIDGDACFHYEPGQGCKLQPKDQPVMCHLSPMRLNDNNTVVLYHRVFQPNSKCYPNAGKGPKIIEAVFDNLVALFGPEKAAHIQDTILAGKDAVIEVAPDIIESVERELQWVKDNVIPKPRNGPAHRPAQHGGKQPSAPAVIPIEEVKPVAPPVGEQLNLF